MLTLILLLWLVAIVVVMVTWNLAKYLVQRDARRRGNRPVRVTP